MNVPDLIDRWLLAEAKAIFCAGGGRVEHFAKIDDDKRDYYLSRARAVVEPQLLAMLGRS
jgi:hypothetical protein